MVGEMLGVFGITSRFVCQRIHNGGCRLCKDQHFSQSRPVNGKRQRSAHFCLFEKRIQGVVGISGIAERNLILVGRPVFKGQIAEIIQVSGLEVRQSLCGRAGIIGNRIRKSRSVFIPILIHGVADHNPIGLHIFVHGILRFVVVVEFPEIVGVALEAQFTASQILCRSGNVVGLQIEGAVGGDGTSIGCPVLALQFVHGVFTHRHQHGAGQLFNEGIQIRLRIAAVALLLTHQLHMNGTDGGGRNAEVVLGLGSYGILDVLGILDIIEQHRCIRIGRGVDKPSPGIHKIGCLHGSLVAPPGVLQGEIYLENAGVGVPFYLLVAFAKGFGHFAVFINFKQTLIEHGHDRHCRIVRVGVHRIQCGRNVVQIHIVDRTGVGCVKAATTKSHKQQEQNQSTCENPLHQVFPLTKHIQNRHKVPVYPNIIPSFRHFCNGIFRLPENFFGFWMIAQF